MNPRVVDKELDTSVENSTATDPRNPIVPAGSSPITTAVQIFRTAEGTCSYISPGGKVSGKKINPKRDGARHWLVTHIQKELEDIADGKLSLEQASIVKTPARLKAAKRYRVFCPYGIDCIFPGKFQIRPDLVVHHIVRCAPTQGFVLSRENAKAWAKNNMALNTDRPQVCRKWKNCWESAIWKIYYAD